MRQEKMPPLAWIGDHPVTRQVLADFENRHLTVSHGDPHAPERSLTAYDFADVFDAYLRYYLLVQEARARGLDEELGFFPPLKELLRLAPYYKQYLLDNALIDPGRFEAALPSQWVKMNFAMKIFPSFKEAHEAKNTLTGREDFLALPDGFRRSEKKAGGAVESGLIWPDSGFFGKPDDGYLFSLKEGDISDPVESGVGAALCLVLERKEYSNSEKEAYITEIRGKLAKDYMRRQIKTVNAQGPYVVHRDRISEIWDKGGVISEDEWDVVVLEFNKIPITYRQAHELHTFNYGWMRRMVPSSKWAKWVSGELQTVAFRLSEGFEGQKMKIERPPNLDKVVDHDVEDLLYRKVQKTLFSEVGEEVSESDTRRYYEENRGLFRTPRSVTVEYYFSPFIGELESSLEKYRSGMEFSELKMPDSGSLGSPHAVVEEGLLKKATFYEGRQGLAGVSESPLELPDGEVTLLQGSLGEYLVLVVERREGTEFTFDQVADKVKDRIIKIRQQEKVRSVVEYWMGKVKITFSKEAEDRMEGNPALPFGELG